MILPLLIAQLAQPPITQREVLAMMDRIPICERGCDAPYRWSRVRNAKAIAAAIAAVAPTRERAAQMAVYAAWESGLDARAESPDHLDHGAWQLRGVSIEIANDPNRAAAVWLGLADQNEALCQGNPPDEQLAALASGSCDHGRAKVKRRWHVAQAILQP